MRVSACEVFPKPLWLNPATVTQDVHLLDRNFIEMRGCWVLGGISVKVMVTSTPSSTYPRDFVWRPASRAILWVSWPRRSQKAVLGLSVSKHLSGTPLSSACPWVLILITACSCQVSVFCRSLAWTRMWVNHTLM